MPNALNITIASFRKQDFRSPQRREFFREKNKVIGPCLLRNRNTLEIDTLWGFKTDISIEKLNIAYKHSL